MTAAWLPSAPQPEDAGGAARQPCWLLPLPSPAVVRVRGKDRVDFLHRLSTNDLLGAAPGQGRYTAFLNTRGRVMDLALALVLDEEVLLIPSPGNAGKIVTLLDTYLFREEVTLLADPSLSCGILFGPGAGSALQRATGCRSEAGVLGDHHPFSIGGIEGEVARDVPLQGDSYRLLYPEKAGDFVELVRDVASLASAELFERCRIEAMLPALGRELSEEFNPWEVSLDRAISLEKGCYLGQEVVARLHTYRKVQRRLAGFELSGPLPDLPAPLYAGLEAVGTLTSAAPAVAGGRVLGLGVARAASCTPGQELRAGTPESATLCRVRGELPPFSESLAGPS